MTSRRISVTIAFSCLSIGHLMLSPMAASQELRPNLRAFPAFDLAVVSNVDTGNPELRFSAASWNSGDGPFEIVAGATGPAGQDVYQRVYNVNGSFTDYLAGTFVWHPEHNHFHFQEYAVYTLEPINAPGQSKREAFKTSFCIMDTGKVDGRLPGAPKKAVYSTCFDQKQGMSIGWGDTYGANLAGQSIDLTGYDDGLFELTIEFDRPGHDSPGNDGGGKIRETNDNDNKACVLLQIGITARTVQNVGTCGASGSVVTISSLSPNSALVGSLVQAEIIGTNFTSPIAVGFESGNGPAPVASNVTVLDSTRIALTISIKQGGKPATDPVWDLRVGSAVLQNAFTVQK